MPESGYLNASSPKNNLRKALALMFLDVHLPEIWIAQPVRSLALK